MGSCVSKKKEVHIQLNRNLADSDSLNESYYYIVDFDPTLKSPKKKEDPDLSLKTRPVASGSVHREEPKILLPEIDFSPKFTPRLDPHTMTEDWERIKKNGLDFKWICPSPLFMTKNKCKLTGRQVSIETYVVYPGCIVLPIRICSLISCFLDCVYEDSSYKLLLIGRVEDSLIFALDKVQDTGYDSAKYSPVKQFMNVSIKGKVWEIVRKPEKGENMYSCNYGVDESMVGQLVMSEDKPCFVIENIEKPYDLKILTCEKLNEFFSRLNPKPESGLRNPGFFYSTGKIKLSQNPKNQNLYEHSENFQITESEISQPVYDLKGQPFAVITAIENSKTIKVTALSELSNYFSSLSKQNIREENYFNSHKKTQENELNPNEEEIILAEVKIQDFDASLSLSSTIRFPEVSPLEISYTLLENAVVKYSSKHYSPEIINHSFSFDKSSTLTTTTKGLLVVSHTKAALFNPPVLSRLKDLSNSHVSHSAVFHKEKVFVLSGKATKSVESFDLDFIDSAWKREQDLPQSIENAASCSAGEFVYVAGGFFGQPLDSVYRYNGSWQMLEWKVPKFWGMGLVAIESKFILFGGKGNFSYNESYFVVDSSGRVVESKDFIRPGVYNCKSVGVSGNAFCVSAENCEFLEFSDFEFKLVTTA